MEWGKRLANATLLLHVLGAAMPVDSRFDVQNSLSWRRRHKA
jgi:hypothetical protein